MAYKSNHKKIINLIFDLDGTLIDSYPAIVERIYILCSKYKLNYKREEIKEFVIRTTVYEFIVFIANKHKLDFETLKNELNNIPQDYNLISLMKETKEFLDVCKTNKFNCYIYTHRGESTFLILKKLKINKYFKEVITYDKGFKNKPDPEGINYLAKKHKMNKDNTYYVGDRIIDVLCANNAKVNAVFYDSSKIDVDIKTFDYKINNLLDLIGIVNKNKSH